MIRILGTSVPLSAKTFASFHKKIYLIFQCGHALAPKRGHIGALTPFLRKIVDKLKIHLQKSNLENDQLEAVQPVKTALSGNFKNRFCGVLERSYPV